MRKNIKAKASSAPGKLAVIAKVAPFMTAEQVLSEIGARCVEIDGWKVSSGVFEGNTLVKGGSLLDPSGYQTGKGGNGRARAEEGEKEIRIPVTEFDGAGTPWQSVVQIQMDQPIRVGAVHRSSERSIRFAVSTNMAASIKAGKPRPVSRIERRPFFLQGEEEIEKIFRRNFPWAEEYVSEQYIGDEPWKRMASYMMYPCVKQLDKAGYSVGETARRLIWLATDGRNHRSLRQTDLDAVNRLLNVRGGSPKKIFKTTKAVYETLKKETDIEKWDTLRKLANSMDLRRDDVELIYGGSLYRHARLVSDVLKSKHEGRSVFTLSSLVSYLNRIDLNEAIGAEEGLQLLADYLRCCRAVGARPKIDGDSLKREHDVMARNAREHRDEIIARKMTGECRKSMKYDYEEDVFLIRSVRDHDDLLDEANQQHNCGAGYAGSIADGKSRIFFLREKNRPEKSLATVELSPNGKEIRQKLLAFNQPIRNKAITEFLERWLTFCRKGGNKGAALERKEAARPLEGGAGDASGKARPEEGQAKAHAALAGPTGQAKTKIEDGAKSREAAPGAAVEGRRTAEINAPNAAEAESMPAALDGRTPEAAGAQGRTALPAAAEGSSGASGGLMAPGGDVEIVTRLKNGSEWNYLVRIKGQTIGTGTMSNEPEMTQMQAAEEIYRRAGIGQIARALGAA